MTHVISCRFLRLGCSEENHSLFRREYARSNRERGVKLLRCFPHCCPEHLKRSYCGCSVHVLVTFSTEVSATMLDEILVCARFEPSRVAPLWPESLAGLARDLGAEDLGTTQENCSLDVGENVSLPMNLSSPRRKQDDGAGEVWIRAERESNEKQQGFPKNTVLYILNNGRSPKWFYSYDSSITRIQREMTHHLVVYTFRLQRDTCNNDVPLQLTDHDNDDNGMHQNAVVLARHASPGFLLVSYRRSRAADNPGCTSSVVGRLGADGNFASPLWLRPEQRLLWQRRDQRLILTGKNNAHGDQHVGYRHVAGTFEDIGISEAQEDSSLWQSYADALYPGFREKGQQLLILWWFLQCISVEEIGFDTELINTHRHSYWLRIGSVLLNPQSNTSAQLDSVMESFLREIFGHVTQTTHTRENVVIQLTVRLFLRALSSCTVQRLIRSAFQVGYKMSSTPQLQKHFALLISYIYDFLNDVVHEVSTREGTKNMSLSALVDDVLSIVYGQTHFGTLREKFSSLLMRQRSLSDNLNSAFRFFMSQTMLYNQEMKQCEVIKTTSSSKSPLQSVWNCRWLLEPGSMEFIYGTPSSSLDVFPGLRFVDVAHSIREFGCVDVDIAKDMSYMVIRSALSIQGDNSSLSPTKLMLDGRLRPFNILPSGLLATIGVAGRWSICDYTAEFSDGGRSLDIDAYAFSVKRSSVSVRDDIEETKDWNVNYGRGGDNGDTSIATLRRVRLTLSLEQEFSGALLSNSVDPRDLFVLVHGGVAGAAYQLPRQHTAVQGDILQLSIEDRAALYESLSWSPLMELQAGYIAIQHSSS